MFAGSLRPQPTTSVLAITVVRRADRGVRIFFTGIEDSVKPQGPPLGSTVRRVSAGDAQKTDVALEQPFLYVFWLRLRG